MLTIDADTARQCLAFERLVPTLRDAFVAGCQAPPRHHHHGVGNAADSTLLLMPAWSERYMGIKVVSVFPGNGQRGLPGLHASYLLCDADTGQHLALIDGDQITARRTAAASALGASYLAREDARELLILGAGRIGSLMAAAYRSVRAIERVRVWNPTAANAERLVGALREDGFDAEVVSDLEAAVKSADCVVGATLSTAPLIHGEWLQAGVHVDLIGSFSPAMREADDAVFARGQVFVDVLGALHESGDLIEPIASGALAEADIRADLATLCRGDHPGRENDNDITVFKAVGTALEDLASATLIYEANAH
ncbi:ornithine cyclodeaminase [Salinisphaera orenii MK-B5]|uniref:Ornithine cyclodeaminase n=1 Tax=Salinisphaera orenii MK-B5 TaxID=856730 RepID=A0A423PG04_9GAMM|nr:ornithine cyclodeaminase family protein [Salinisphaera orenii]ROO24426.1 ornithine cyclodeaminase [Salinisphaera orenii MK-B5]